MQTDIIGVSIGIIGIAVSYYFYRKSLRIKEPCWAIRSNNLIEGYSDKVENLKVTFNNNDIENLTISKVLLWNDGAETIEKQDIETTNKLRIECNNYVKILDTKILATNNESSQFEITISEENNQAFIQFDYLDQKQGAVIQVIHTGTSSKDLSVTGDIKGVKTLISKSVKPKWSQWLNEKLDIPRRTYRRITGSVTILFGLIYIALGTVRVFVPTFLSSPTVQNSQKEQIPQLVVLFLGGVIMLLMGYSRVKVISPKGLEVYYKE